MSTEFAIARTGGDHLDAVTSLANFLGCSIEEAEERLLDGTAGDETRRAKASDETRRAQPPPPSGKRQRKPRRGIAGHLAYNLIVRR